MRLLLDTHAAVWWLDDKGQLVVKVDSNLPDGSRLDVTVVYRKK